MKERNKIFNYLLLIISSLIVGVWQFREDSGRKEYLIILIFLLIVPLTSFFLSLMYCWHDFVISSLASYINKVLRPIIVDEVKDENMLMKICSCGRNF